MKMVNYTALCLILLCHGELLIRVYMQQDIFLQMPVPVRTAINTTVVFNCTAGGHALTWYINGDILSHNHITERGITINTTWLESGAISSLLYMKAIEENNNTDLECGVFKLGEGVTRSRATNITIQGLLSAPSELRVDESGKDSINLSWKSPFTIDGVPITGFELRYTTQAGKEEIHNIPQISNAGDPIYYLFNGTSLGAPSPCTIYNFNVRALNEGGPGTFSNVTHGYFIDDPIPLDGADVRTMVEFRPPNISVLLMLEDEVHNITTNCPGKAAENFTIHMQSLQNESLECTHADNEESFTISTINFATTTKELPLNHHYITNVTSINSAGVAMSTGAIYTSTYDVQNLTVDEDDGELCMRCIFALGSSAQGCVIVIQDLEVNETVLNNTQFCKSIYRTGLYTINVYDKESDGTVSFTDFPAYVITNISLIGKAPAPTIPAMSKDAQNDSLIVIVVVTIVAVAIVAVVVIAAVSAILYRRNSRKSAAVDLSRARDRSPHLPMEPNPAYDSVTPVRNLH